MADSAASAALRRRLNLTAEAKVGGMETTAACRQRRLLVFLLHSAACCVPETEGTDVEHDVTGAGDEPLDR